MEVKRMIMNKNKPSVFNTNPSVVHNLSSGLGKVEQVFADLEAENDLL
jgi:hypothetical protein